MLYAIHWPIRKVAIFFSIVAFLICQPFLSQASDDQIKTLIQDLRSQNSKVSEAAEDALEKMKDPMAVEFLIPIALNEEESPVLRWHVIGILGAIKHNIATQPLLDIIRSTAKTPGDLPYGLFERTIGDLSIRQKARYALANIGTSAVPYLTSALNDNTPIVRKEAAKVLAVIASGTLPSGEHVSSKEAVEVLMNAAKAKNLSIVASAYDFFILKGDKKLEPILVKALQHDGDKDMALSYLNSGNSVLKKAAISWAKANGYNITDSTSFPGGYNLYVGGKCKYYIMGNTK